MTKTEAVKHLVDQDTDEVVHGADVAIVVVTKESDHTTRCLESSKTSRAHTDSRRASWGSTRDSYDNRSTAEYKRHEDHRETSQRMS